VTPVGGLRQDAARALQGILANEALTQLTRPDLPATECQEYRQSPAWSFQSVASEAVQDIESPALNTFRLTAFDVGEDGAEDVQLVVDTPSAPSIRRHASLALIYGLAIMTLDQDGTIERRVDELMAAGMISEVDAVNKINLLLLKDVNDEVV